MSWSMFIVVAILLIVLHHFFVKKIDKEDSKEYHTSSSTSTLRTSLCNRLKSYRDFKLIEDSVTSALISNNKGEEFSIQSIRADYVVAYKVKGIVKKEWKFPFWVHETIAFREIEQYYDSLLNTKDGNNATQWKLKSTRHFTKEELDLVDKAQVVESQYGYSCCFFMKNGTKLYVPMSKDSKSKAGDYINLNEAEIVTLSKEGEKDIQRIKG